jgi:DNA-binding GntR family transcriptional regulator
MDGEVIEPPVTQADRVCAELCIAIERGEILPGEKLNEQALVERFGGSRVPIREAIQKLESRHLVQRIPHVGARVVKHSLKELRDIYEVRQELEGMACRLAAQRMTEASVVELRTLLDGHAAMIDAEQGANYYQKAGDLDFHYRIIQGSDNHRLQRVLCGELYHVVRMYRYQTSTSQHRPQHALREHRHIVDAIAARDAELAELLMRRHIQVSLNNLECLMKENTTS